MTDYKALYEQQLEENKKLKKRLTHNTTTIRKLKKDFDCLEAEATFENEKLIAEVKQLKPVSKDTEKEYDYVFESQRKEIIELKDKVKYLENEVCRYSNAIEEEYVLKTDYDQLENDSLVEEEEICINCDRKKKGPGDMFIIHQELFHGVKENWCSQCYMKKLGK
jgi:predicted RNase H-like nuclease (RuvC/YqgF family)